MAKAKFTAKKAPPTAGKALVIVESPSKAKTINKYLGSEYIVLASVGHIRDIPAKGLNIDIKNGFKPTYEINDDKRAVLNELKTAAKNASEVYLATDLDREGEAIAWHLVQALGLDVATAKRVVFNEITKAAILTAFKSPRLIDTKKVDAQQARRIVDRLVGYQVSPILWKKVAGRLSAGRVQSIAVKLVVDRELEIRAFIPEEYWKLVGVFTADTVHAGELTQQWQNFLSRDEEESTDDGSDSAELAAAQNRGRTVAEKTEWMSGNKAFRAELVEFSGKKFDPKNADDARAAAEAVGVRIVSVETNPNDGSNGPRGIPPKGPAENITKIIGDVVRNSGVEFSVRELNTKQSTSRPPGPFQTSTLQQAASNALGFGAQRTMGVAQALYQGIELGGDLGAVGLITYMRTDSQNISADAIKTVRGYIDEQLGPKYLPESPNVYSSRANAQEAHEAIRPTDVSLTPSRVRAALTDEQFKLYDLIWRRFVACQMTPALWNVTEALIDAKRGGSAVATFKATGRSLAFDGFMKVAGVFTRADEQILPELKTNQKVAPLDLTPTQHFTAPPARYSEASLVKALEAEGIGRPSTYASIINTIQDPKRNYVESRGRALYATDLGIKVTEKLIEGFPDIMDTGFTRKIELELDQIEDASKNWVEVVEDFYGPFSKDLATAEKRMTHARAETEPSPYECPICKSPMVYRLSRFGKRFLSCTKYPECKGAMNVDRDGKPQQLDITEYKCPNCGKPMIRRTGRFGVFFGCSGYPECKIIQNADKKTGLPLPPKPPPVDTGLLCPKCGKKNIVVREGKRGPFMSCSGFPRCRTTLPADRLEEFKKSVSETGKWPEDIVAKFGTPKVAPAEETAKEEKPKKAAAKKKAPAKPKKAAPIE